MAKQTGDHETRLCVEVGSRVTPLKELKIENWNALELLDVSGCYLLGPERC